MKIKESNEKISLNKLTVLFAVSFVACLALRTVQMFSFIDHETGFYTGGNILAVVLYSVIAVSSVLFCTVSFLSAESKKIDVYTENNTAVRFVSILFAVSFFYDAVSAFISTGDSLVASSSATPFRTMMLSGSLPLFFRSVFAFLSGIYFIIFSKSILKGNTVASKHRILALAPVGWAGFRIVHRFVEQISYIRVSDLLLELIEFAFMIIFFMAFTQVATGVYSEQSRWRLCGLGFPAALVALSLNGARLIFILIEGSEAVNSNYPYCLTDFVFGLFAAVFLVNAIKTGKRSADKE